MQLIEVKGAAAAKEFLLVNVFINKDNPAYIRPLDKDINDIFDPKKNKAYRFGTAVRWIVKDEGGKAIGRIAAFVNKRYKNKGDDVPIGGIGFFDCINDQAAANALFEKAKTWLADQGMQAMDGPINFGERDQWWGLVTEGFQSPLYGMNYNPPYYKTLFENYGFRLFFEQICFGIDPKKRLMNKLFERHARFAGNPSFRTEQIKKNKLDKYAEDFTTVYNKAWAGHGGLKQLRKEQVVHMFEKMKPVMDEKLIWFAYHNNDPVALFVNLPDLNQWFKYLDGKFDVLHKLKFLWVKLTKPSKKFVGLVFGVVPEFQGKGMDSYIIVESAKVIQELSYTEYEMQWIGDFNPKMMNVVESMTETYRSRTLTTYRYLFDRTKEFKRHPVLL